MDKWMVAVAAGAGYIAQHFKKLKENGLHITPESSFEGSSSIKPDPPNPTPDKKWPFHMLSNRDSLKKDDSEVKIEDFQVISRAEMTSTSDIDGEKGLISGNWEGNLVNKPSTPRSRISLRSRRAVRPLSSLESCLMAHVETKEYIVSPSRQTVRPFLVTDGSKVINRASGDVFIVQNNDLEKKVQTYSEENNKMDATLLVCLGMSFGILYSFMTNKFEVEKLNCLLKQKESLVQDLEEEIEMKDSLIMQEITIEDQKSQIMNVSVSENNKESVIKKVKDDSFSKIEAELEAELEMLELNMTSSTLERKISNLVELDPDFEPDVAQGELWADMVDNNHQDENGSRSTITIHSPNYAVSPRELSLRLHEVLESQLEERIRELEAEIESKQTLNHKSWKDDENHVDEPVVLNLSGEALDAYNEACNEFAKFDESDEENVYSAEDYNSGGTSIDDEKDFDEDEMEKLLIQQIVEKARQGSPVVLNAQRALFSE